MFNLTIDIHHARFPLFLPMIDDGGTDQIFCHVKKIQYKLRRLMIDTEKWSMHWISKILICQWLVPGFISGYRYQCQKSSQSVILKISHDPTFHTLTENVGFKYDTNNMMELPQFLLFISNCWKIDRDWWMPKPVCQTKNCWSKECCKYMV